MCRIYFSEDMQVIAVAARSQFSSVAFFLHRPFHIYFFRIFTVVVYFSAPKLLKIRSLEEILKILEKFFRIPEEFCRTSRRILQELSGQEITDYNFYLYGKTDKLYKW